MDPQPSPEKSETAVKANSAFSSPTALAARLSRTRSPPTVPNSKSSVSARSGRTSVVRSESEEDIMKQMAVTTTVSYTKPKTPEPSSPVPGMTNEQVQSAMAMADNAISTANQLVHDTSAEAKKHLSSARLEAKKHLATANSLLKETGNEARKHLSTIGSIAYSSRGIAPSVGTASVSVSNENASVSTRSTSLSSASRKDLDLKHNDNAFHVVANLVVDRFQSQVPPGATSYTLTEDDLAHLDQMVPASVRTSFVEAVRYRLENNCPPDSMSHVHQLTRQAKIYGLDRKGDDNPLLASLNPSGKPITISNLPPKQIPITPPADSRSLTGFPSAAKAPPASASVSGGELHRPPLPPTQTSTVAHMEQENREFRARVEEQQKQLRIQQEQRSTVPSTVPIPNGEDVSFTASSFAGASVSAAEAHVSSTESLARQQLMAELREASNLMAESVTPEAAQFWRNHVVDLQARLRALHNGSPVQGFPSPSATAEELMESNRRIMEKYDTPTEPQSYPHEGVYPIQPPSQPPTQPVVSSHPPQPTPEMPRQRPEPASRDFNIPMVDVVAPADLPGGYHFEAEIEGRRFLATVPPGGVRRGQTFSCAMRSLETVGADIPVGRWRDRICDCGVHGFDHPLVLNTILCPLLALGQVMTRLNLDILGRPREVKHRNTPWGTMIIVVTFWLGMNFLVYSAYNYKWSRNLPLSSADRAAIVAVNLVVLFFGIYVTASTRGALREKYMIREHRCFDLEDCFCATFCMPCTICQMARHTASYDHVGSACCSSTGLTTENPLNISKSPSDVYMV